MNYLTKLTYVSTQQISADQAKKFSRVNYLTLHPNIVDEIEDLAQNVLPVSQMVGIRTHTDVTDSVNIIEVTFIPKASTGIDHMIQFKQSTEHTQTFRDKLAEQEKRETKERDAKKVEEKKASQDPLGTIVKFAVETPRLVSKYPKLLAGFISQHHTGNTVVTVTVTHRRESLSHKWYALLPAAHETVHVDPKAYVITSL